MIVRVMSMRKCLPFKFRILKMHFMMTKSIHFNIYISLNHESLWIHLTDTLMGGIVYSWCISVFHPYLVSSHETNFTSTDSHFSSVINVEQCSNRFSTDVLKTVERFSFMNLFTEHEFHIFLF